MLVGALVCRDGALDALTFFTWWREGTAEMVPIVAGVVPVMEKLEKTELLKLLSETSDTLERWVKVQMLWCSLESVFTSGDIASSCLFCMSAWVYV